MYGCERVASTKNLSTLFTAGVSLKEIARLRGDRIKSAQIIKSGHFATLAVCVGTVISLWALGLSQISEPLFSTHTLQKIKSPIWTDILQMSVK